MKKKYNGDFNYQKSNPTMGALSNDLIDLALVTVGEKIQKSPEEKKKAIYSLTEVGSTAIYNNRGYLIAGLLIFGSSMALTNVAITRLAFKNGNK